MVVPSFAEKDSPVSTCLACVRRVHSGCSMHLLQTRRSARRQHDADCRQRDCRISAVVTSVDLVTPGSVELPAEISKWRSIEATGHG